MDVFEAIKERRSVRAYKDRDVEEEKLRKPWKRRAFPLSASNRQEWKFIVVKNAETRARLAGAAYGQRSSARRLSSSLPAPRRPNRS